MMIDEKASIKSIMLALSIHKAEVVAKEIRGISQKPFLGALKEAGYEYSQKSPKGWHYIADGVEPLDKSIFDFVKRSSSVKNSDSPKVHNPIIQSNTDSTLDSPSIHKPITQSNTDSTCDSPSIHPQFTRDEVVKIKEMLKSWKQITAPTVESITLHERIKQLPTGDKTRKTVVIDSAVGIRLDEFCDAEKVYKSDVLHLALLDFIQRYQ